MTTLLIVEDNKNTMLLTKARLKSHFDVLCAYDGLEAIDIIYDKKIDIIVADIMMPNMDGYQLIKRLREEKYDIPVILLTAKQSFEDKQQGFTLGSDDYMTKPVNYDELLLRIKALLRRAKISYDKKIQIGNIVINSTDYSLINNKTSIPLTKKEFELLYKMISYPNKIFTKNQLLDDIWGFNTYSTEDTIKTHIGRLRSKCVDCKEFEIITVKGLGYKAIIINGEGNE